MNITTIEITRGAGLINYLPAVNPPPTLHPQPPPSSNYWRLLQDKRLDGIDRWGESRRLAALWLLLPVNPPFL